MPLSLFNAPIDTDLFPSIESVHHIEGKNKGTGGPSVETVRGWLAYHRHLNFKGHAWKLYAVGLVCYRHLTFEGSHVETVRDALSTIVTGTLRATR